MCGGRGELTQRCDELCFSDVRVVERVTGGRAGSVGAWTELMAGPGPLPNTLLAVLGPRLRSQFEEELTAEMEPLGGDAFRYHFAYIFATGVLPAEA